MVLVQVGGAPGEGRNALRRFVGGGVERKNNVRVFLRPKAIEGSKLRRAHLRDPFIRFLGWLLGDLGPMTRTSGDEPAL